MPTYDYVCSACGHQFELFQSMTDPVKRKCPACGKPKLDRLIGTGAGVIFKGGGFYETDYRSDSYKKAAEADTTAAGGANPDSKPDPGPVTTASSSDAKPPAAASTGDSPAATKPSKSSRPRKPRTSR
jgi:putative FmdB family regulatory protein